MEQSGQALAALQGSLLTWQLLEVVVAIIIIIIIIIKPTTHPDDEQQHHHHQHEGAMWGKNANESQEYYVWR